ncbi:hypothetical protein PQJ75_00635 [Rhodoplanes sp. TEM]|nr:hypothetical protein [Rhodoplanes sp. TEM]MDC7982225.1 hypothetical protein [Rhodoplanes sp. TEM]MDQ0356232.1 hypothetical protein [Rhodoplanes tepidamans]
MVPVAGDPRPVFYNPELLPQYIAGEVRDEFTIVDAHLLDELRAFYEVFGWTHMGDRSGALPFFLRMTNDSPMPRDATSKTLAEIMMERATELVAMGRPLKVFWSGGVDSTAMIVSLLRAGARPDQVEIYLTTDGIAEYQWFFSKVIYGGRLPFRLIRPTESQAPTIGLREYPDPRGRRRVDPRPTPGPGDVWVTGELFNCLFGPHNAKIDIARETDEQADYRLRVPGRVLDFIAPLIDGCPRPLAGFPDLAWYQMFTCHWVKHKHRFVMNLPRKPDGYIRFCDTPDFQRWALTNAEPKMKDERGRPCYKHPLKRFIFEFTGDEAYFAKGKVGSMPIQPGHVPAANPMFYRYLMDDGEIR